MPSRPLADQLQDSIVNAAHLLRLVLDILANPDSSQTPPKSTTVHEILGPAGTLRMERCGDCIILDAAPVHPPISQIGPGTFRIQNHAGTTSRLFPIGKHLPHDAFRIIGSTLNSLTSNCSLNIINADRLRAGLLIRHIEQTDQPIYDIHSLVDQACQGIAAALPDNRALHRAWSALGMNPRLAIVDAMTNEITEIDSPRVKHHIQRLIPYLNELPHALMLIPDSDNHNTVTLTPFAANYSAPSNRVDAIVRLASTFIRLDLLRDNRV